ncbi:MAG: sugar kinase, partial [Elusimicrobia bacterium]|nr:sugar kinase [Elusimicrobiota bacterium]
MKILVLGSVGLDTIETPAGKVTDVVGGSACYFACAARYFTTVHLMSVVGTDFQAHHRAFLNDKCINLDCLTLGNGLTFRWSGFYGENLNDAQTRATTLNVLETFIPQVPEQYRSLPAVFLANFDPLSQAAVLDQLHAPRLIAADTMNLWILTKKPELLQLLKRLHILVLNDTEAKMLTQKSNILQAAREITRLGPSYVIIKKGEHGSMMFDGK